MTLTIGLGLSFIAIWLIALFSNVDSLVSMLLVNGFLQIVFFIFVACIPYLRTKRMSYVDIAWPFGVALIGVMILLFGEGATERKFTVGVVYLFIGLRMGIGALTMAKTTGVIVKTEFPRYQYRRMLIENTGTKHVDFHMLTDVLLQGLANISVLALPGFLIATNGSPSLLSLEIAGLFLWGLGYVVESVADGQKMLFIAKNTDNRQGVCNIGLWRYSRHPNYFGEWLVWSGLVVAAVPSWLALQSIETSLVWITLGLGTLCASVMMYTTLVYLTGAVPAEYYSLQKRPQYSEYQKTTNMFFPGPLKQ
ncbi:MAG: DUF1295 domain-containing protein [SAR324 cluster bacterium]|nr:DUF1295 domain-containing protein [SAR324 cluster bacterium]